MPDSEGTSLSQSECQADEAMDYRKYRKFGTSEKKHHRFWTSLLLFLCAVLVAMTSLLSVWWLRHRVLVTLASASYSVEFGIDSAAMKQCVSDKDGMLVSDFSSYQDSCLKPYGNGSLAMVAGLGQPLIPLKPVWSAEPHSLKHFNPSVNPEGPKNELTIALPGLYHLDGQVTFVEPDLEASVKASLQLNGVCMAHCYQFSPSGISTDSASLLSCPISTVRRLAPGARIGISAGSLLRLAGDPRLTYLRVTRLLTPAARRLIGANN